MHGRLGSHTPPPGDLTERDAWRMVPYENRIALLHLTATELRAVIEESLAQPPGRPGMGVSGIQCEIDPSAPAGSRVRRIFLPDGRTPHARQRFRTAINSHVLASAGGRFPTVRRLAGEPEVRRDLTPLDTRTLLMEWWTRLRTISAETLPPPGYRKVTPAENR